MAQPERKIRSLQKKFENEDENAKDQALKSLLGNQLGRRFLWLQLADCHIFSTPFSLDANETAFRCGEQNAGQRLLAQIVKAQPDAFLTMMKENQDVDRSRSELTNAASEPDPRDDSTGWYDDDPGAGAEGES